MSKGSLLVQEGGNVREARQQKTDLSKMQTNKSAQEDAAKRAAESVSRGPAKPQTVIRNEEKVGRNDLCPCGSGKKYKHCHGRN